VPDSGSTGSAQPTTDDPSEPVAVDPDATGSNIDVTIPDGSDRDSTVRLLITLTLLSVAPSLLVMMTSFTRFIIVFGLTRNALGLGANVPPNQVIAGLALIMSLFVMWPVLSAVNEVAVEPYLSGDLSATEAIDAGTVPMREFMLANTRDAELKLFLDAGDLTPASAEETPMQALIPAFVLSELKTAFIIGLVIYLPFVVIDIVIPAILMALGMMMTPPTFISIPVKLTLFVLLDGWVLITSTLLTSFRGSG
jgi:flagellar biosynthetic protein FliP